MLSGNYEGGGIREPDKKKKENKKNYSRKQGPAMRVITSPQKGDNKEGRKAARKIQVIKSTSEAGPAQ